MRQSDPDTKNKVAPLLGQGIGHLFGIVECHLECVERERKQIGLVVELPTSLCKRQIVNPWRVLTGLKKSGPVLGIDPNLGFAEDVNIDLVPNLSRKLQERRFCLVPQGTTQDESHARVSWDRVDLHLVVRMRAVEDLAVITLWGSLR